MKAPDQIIRLYDGPAPGSEAWTHHEQENFSPNWQTQVVFNVTDPMLSVFMPDPAIANGTAVVICPGGGFHALSINSEGFDVARWLVEKGVTCFVLKYRLVECKSDNPAQQLADVPGDLGRVVAPVVRLAMADGLAAVGYVRQHAHNYGINPNCIGITGFSAGGTVTASVAFNYNTLTRPNFVAPIYLEYSWVPRSSVPIDAPPIFILAATDDPLGLAPHSIQLYNDWTAAGRSAELHLYSTGGHGFGMRTQLLPSDRWITLLADWLGVQGMLNG